MNENNNIDEILEYLLDNFMSNDLIIYKEDKKFYSKLEYYSPCGSGISLKDSLLSLINELKQKNYLFT